MIYKRITGAISQWKALNLLYISSYKYRCETQQKIRKRKNLSSFRLQLITNLTRFEMTVDSYSAYHSPSLYYLYRNFWSASSEVVWKNRSRAEPQINQFNHCLDVKCTSLNHHNCSRANILNSVRMKRIFLCDAKIPDARNCTFSSNSEKTCRSPSWMRLSEVDNVSARIWRKHFLHIENFSKVLYNKDRQYSRFCLMIQQQCCSGIELRKSRNTNRQIIHVFLWILHSFGCPPL